WATLPNYAMRALDRATRFAIEAEAARRSHGPSAAAPRTPSCDSPVFESAMLVHRLSVFGQRHVVNRHSHVTQGYARSWFYRRLAWHRPCTADSYGRGLALCSVRPAPASGAGRRDRHDGAVARRVLAPRRSRLAALPALLVRTPRVGTLRDGQL